MGCVTRASGSFCPSAFGCGSTKGDFRNAEMETGHVGVGKAVRLKKLYRLRLNIRHKKQY